MPYNPLTEPFIRANRFESDPETENLDDIRQVDFDRHFDDVVGGVNILRESFSEIANSYLDLGSLTTTGTGTALELATTIAMTTLTAGVRLTFKAHTDILEDATINVDGLGAKALKELSSSGVNVRSGSFPSESYVQVVYDGASWVMMNASSSSEVAAAVAAAAAATAAAAANTSAIAANTSAIATNTSAAAANTSSIATNTSAITAIESAVNHSAKMKLLATRSGDNDLYIQWDEVVFDTSSFWSGLTPYESNFSVPAGVVGQVELTCQLFITGGSSAQNVTVSIVQDAPAAGRPSGTAWLNLTRAMEIQPLNASFDQKTVNLSTGPIELDAETARNNFTVTITGVFPTELQIDAAWSHFSIVSVPVVGGGGGGGGAMTDLEVKTAYENNTDTEALTTALLAKLNGIEAAATADQNATEILALLDIDQGGTEWRATTEVMAIRSGFITAPGTTETFDFVYLPNAWTIQNLMAGAGGVVLDNPTATYVISVQDDAVEIGTISISTGGAYTFATVLPSDTVFAAGSTLGFVSPGAADATIGRVSFTIPGTV